MAERAGNKGGTNGWEERAGKKSGKRSAAKIAGILSMDFYYGINLKSRYNATSMRKFR